MTCRIVLNSYIHKGKNKKNKLKLKVYFIKTQKK